MPDILDHNDQLAQVVQRQADFGLTAIMHDDSATEQPDTTSLKVRVCILSVRHLALRAQLGCHLKSTPAAWGSAGGQTMTDMTRPTVHIQRCVPHLSRQEPTF